MIKVCLREMKERQILLKWETKPAVNVGDESIMNCPDSCIPLAVIDHAYT
jgi:hypothetical protein